MYSSKTNIEKIHQDESFLNGKRQLYSLVKILDVSFPDP